MEKISQLTLKLLISFLVFNTLVFAVKYKLTQTETPKEQTITLKERERQLECLSRNIYYEAANEPFEGKVGVAQVTLNRASSGKFPADICLVVS